MVSAIARDWRQAGLQPENEALCLYADKLTRHPTEMNEADIDSLRQHGFDDQAIHDATQVISYFNYINRIADGLNVDLEQDIRAWEADKA